MDQDAAHAQACKTSSLQSTLLMTELLFSKIPAPAQQTPVEISCYKVNINIQIMSRRIELSRDILLDITGILKKKKPLSRH